MFNMCKYVLFIIIKLQLVYNYSKKLGITNFFYCLYFFISYLCYFVKCRKHIVLSFENCDPICTYR